MRSDYPSSLDDSQWQSVQILLPPPSDRGRTRGDRRPIFDAILYWNRTGCQWRYLPREFGPWQTVYRVYRGWIADGTWIRLNDILRRMVRQNAGKQAEPTAAVVDSQSVKTAEGGLDRGYDAGKKTAGRKRHIGVDTLGMLIAVVVHSASVQDYTGARAVLFAITRKCRTLLAVFADGAYGKVGLPDWTQRYCEVVLQVVLRPVEAKGFVILPKRWIVERTFAWISRHRRASKDYERLIECSEAVCYIAMIDLMLRRLSKA